MGNEIKSAFEIRKELNEAYNSYLQGKLLLTEYEDILMKRYVFLDISKEHLKNKYKKSKDNISV